MIHRRAGRRRYYRTYPGLGLHLSSQQPHTLPLPDRHDNIRPAPIAQPGFHLDDVPFTHLALLLSASFDLFGNELVLGCVVHQLPVIDGVAFKIPGSSHICRGRLDDVLGVAHNALREPVQSSALVIAAFTEIARRYGDAGSIDDTLRGRKVALAHQRSRRVQRGPDLRSAGHPGLKELLPLAGELRAGPCAALAVPDMRADRLVVVLTERQIVCRLTSAAGGVGDARGPVFACHGCRTAQRRRPREDGVGNGIYVSRGRVGMVLLSYPTCIWGTVVTRGEERKTATLVSDEC